MEPNTLSLAAIIAWQIATIIAAAATIGCAAIACVIYNNRLRNGEGGGATLEKLIGTSLTAVSGVALTTLLWIDMPSRI
ncbi:hypothetical protein [Sphingosinicella sp. BN140058]|uniref:hypothetical protein n=1 Tax=Sphingosinicella sp. BN140058 TaxID=1892855 RepID=UPI00101105CE|nr:hypothetical protein [Sphingosinicella sp. BN140058]QAY80281.1 hypothetical protein ETR14_26930 [Sphingosinicella sp. BN140058]